MDRCVHCQAVVWLDGNLRMPKKCPQCKKEMIRSKMPEGVRESLGRETGLTDFDGEHTGLYDWKAR